MTRKTQIRNPWPRNTAAGRWYGLGRYLAMFPPAFAKDAVHHLTRIGEPVLDPCCGRGNGPFTAAVMGRPTVAIDINPVAWIFTETKLHPAQDSEQVIARLNEIGRVGQTTKYKQNKNETEFEKMSWAPQVRAFLRAARGELDWRNPGVDQTLTAFIALHMQDTRRSGLSNSMSPTIAYSPEYAVKWWTQRGLTKPPDVDPVAMLTDKIRRRYKCGVPEQAQGTAILGDARKKLPQLANIEAGLLITSPPYCGVADYWNDNWLRLWLLGYDFRKDWRRSERYQNRENYRKLVQEIFQESSRHLKRGAAILVRVGQARNTASVCIEMMQETWPNRKLFVRSTTAPHNSISVLHGRGGRAAQDIDILIPGKRGKSWWEKEGFGPLK